jgi:leader peptidase (prepilin peptidase)/N-methyltransferase
MSIIPYIIISFIAIALGQIVAHLNKKMPPVVAEEITYKEFFSTLKCDFKLDILYTIIFLIIFNCLVYFNGNTLQTYLYTIVCAALAITFSIDFRFQLIPDEVHIVLVIVGVINLICNVSLKTILNSILGAVIGGGIFFLISLLALLIFKKEGMGFGDIKLMAALGFVFGAKNILVITLVSFVIGAIVGSIILIVKNKNSDGYIPFGPFIAIAAITLMFVPADTIIDIYITFCSWLGDKMTDAVYYLIER